MQTIHSSRISDIDGEDLKIHICLRKLAHLKITNFLSIQKTLEYSQTTHQ